MTTYKWSPDSRSQPRSDVMFRHPVLLRRLPHWHFHALFSAHGNAEQSRVSDLWLAGCLLFTPDPQLKLGTATVAKGAFPERRHLSHSGAVCADCGLVLTRSPQRPTPNRLKDLLQRLRSIVHESLFSGHSGNTAPVAVTTWGHLLRGAVPTAAFSASKRMRDKVLSCHPVLCQSEQGTPYDFAHMVQNRSRLHPQSRQPDSHRLHHLASADHHGNCQGGCRVSVFHVHADSRSSLRRFELRASGLSITFPTGVHSLTPPVQRLGFSFRTSS